MWQRRALALVSAMIAAAALVNAPPAAADPKAGEKIVSLWTQDAAPGGFMKAKIAYRENEKYPGYYKGSIDGTIQDMEEDGWCVMGYYRATVKVEGKGASVFLDRPLRPRIAACPKGISQPIHHPFEKAKDVRIFVCLTKDGGKTRGHCSPVDH
jgi:hypothetical protein